MTGDERLAKVAEVLAAHRHPGEILTVLGDAWLACGCGERIDLPVSLGRVHRNAVDALWNAHVARALLPVVEQEIAAAKAEALQESADAWQRGQWTAITAKVKARNVLGTAQIVGDWIRARAALGGERETGR